MEFVFDTLLFSIRVHNIGSLNWQELLYFFAFMHNVSDLHAVRKSDASIITVLVIEWLSREFRLSNPKMQNLEFDVIWHRLRSKFNNNALFFIQRPNCQTWENILGCASFAKTHPKKYVTVDESGTPIRSDAVRALCIKIESYIYNVYNRYVWNTTYKYNPIIIL